MNKLLLLFSLVFPLTLFTACGDDEKEEYQDYTSFVFIQTIDNELPNCIAGYKKNGKYYKLGDLGTLKIKNQYSPEIRVNDNSITEIYLFNDLAGGVRVDATYTLKPNIKNIFKILETIKGIEVTDKTDPAQYPQ